MRRILEITFWLLVLAAAFVFPYNLPLITQILIMGLFAVSLDLALGYAGILTVGHAAFFGIGAYGAGILAVWGWQEAFSGLVFAFILNAILGYALSFLIVRGSDLTRLTITVAICLVLTEAARQFSGLTGGTDGLQGVEISPILGYFEFDLFGHTAFAYTFLVVLILFAFTRRILRSPFGLMLKGIHNNNKRMHAIGTPVFSQLRLAYAFSAAIAGVAGALLAQTTQFVSVDTLSFDRSAEILIMLVLGGVGHLYGGLVGAAAYMVLQDQLSSISPEYWMLGIGILLIIVSMTNSGGILGFFFNKKANKDLNKT